MVETNNIGLLGSGGQAREMIDYAKSCGLEVAFWSANKEFEPSHNPVHFIPVEQLSAEIKDIRVICAVGAPGLKKQFVDILNEATFTSLISSSSYLATDIKLADGVTIAPQVGITSGTNIGSHVLVNTGATISHDCTIGDFATIGPGSHLGGNVTVGEGTVIGIGAIIKHGVTVGSHAYIGAGAVVINDIDDYTVAFGVPAQEQSKRSGWIYEL